MCPLLDMDLHDEHTCIGCHQTILLCTGTHGVSLVLFSSVNSVDLLQALVQDAVLKFKKDGKSSPKTQQQSESDTQQLLSPRNILSMNPAQQTRASPGSEGRHTMQQV